MINGNKINALLKEKEPDKKWIRDIVQKSLDKRRLSLKETAALLSVSDTETLEELFLAAKKVKEEIYGNRLVIFAPLYISNLCKNDCLYCAFRSTNKEVDRCFLSMLQIKQETEAILKAGQKRILLVAGESYPNDSFQYILDAIKTVYSARDGKNNIRRVNVNIAPLNIDQFKELKKSGIGTYQLFQETYHKETYEKMHVKGPKADYEKRINTIDKAFEAEIDDVGLGVLFGLYDYKFEVLALMMHIEYLEKKFGLGPHTLSVPRLEPAIGSSVSLKPPYPVSDIDFKKIIAVLRLSVPYTGIILSTRETPEIRRESFSLGISQISAGSRTNPGGYSDGGIENREQFSLGDHRQLDEVILDVCRMGYIPSFCTGCYRLGRTGLDFMELAKPGEIKNKCLPNALISFKEYICDYASEDVKILGDKMILDSIDKIKNENIKKFVINSLGNVEQGARDIYC
ncbi:[FeFe] hydrogenase H-cluster radical SAM maturase HydG [candidate division WOR-1 bacterium RIFOXYA12_FULL_36_13]|nr:MAG: [FeFe] hydrogenase H-cluster radical SAM maturase HydG [candidate division WOR-1 bacterium RIFOXYA12_FULL_36_13]